MRLDINYGVSNTSATITAISANNSSINDSKVVSCTYDLGLDGLIIEGADVINNANNESLYSVAYIPSNTSHRNVTWSISSGTNYATIDANGKVTVLDAAGSGQDIVIKVTGDGNVTATKNVRVIYNTSECQESFVNDSYNNIIASTGGSVSVNIYGNQSFHNVEGYFEDNERVDPENMVNTVEVIENTNDNLGTGVVNITFRPNYTDHEKEAIITINGTGVCSGFNYQIPLSFTQAGATVVQDITAITGVSESEENMIGDSGIQLNVEYSPSNAIEQSKGVTWSISGRSAQHFNISQSGLLTITDYVPVGSEITITATSTYNSNITKSVTVTLTGENE